MNISKNAVAGGVAALGGSGAVAGVVIANQNKETIGEKFKEITRLPKTNANELWKARLTNSEQDTKIKELLKEKTQESDKISALQQWCESKLNEKTTEELSKKFQKFCTYTIKEKMGEWALTTTTSETHETEYKELLSKLKEHAKEDLGAKLKEIKGKNETKTWEELKNWCEEKYKQHFEENNDIWSLVNKFCKKPTIQDKLKGTELPETSEVDTDWGTKATSAESNAKDDALKKDLKTENKKDKLKKWCKEQYVKVYDLKIPENGTETLLSEVKKYCTLKISEKIDTSKKFTTFEGTEDDTRWGAIVTTLTTYTANTNTNKPELTDKLLGIKNIKGDSDNSQKKSQLKTWCKDTYEQGYKGENDLWNLVKEFCYKTA